VKEHAEPEIVIMLVGNKLDLCESNPAERKVSREYAQGFAEKNQLLFMETSAYQDLNVRDCFELLVQEIFTVQNSNEVSDRRK
jgi:Rab family protein